MKNSYQTIETDVLVVGGGGAACRAALEAHNAGADVTLIVKGAFASIGIRGAGSTAGGVSDRGGSCFPGGPNIQGFDTEAKPLLTPQEDFENIIQLGLGMTDRKLAQILAEQAYETMRPFIEDWSGEIIPRQWGMKSHGIPIMVALTRLLKLSSIRIIEHTMVADLLLADDHAAGAIAVDEYTGNIIVIEAGAVILGTGGAGGLFKHSLASPCTTGDGYAMAYKAGAELMNLEFKQVFPGVIYPTINHFSAWFFIPHVKITNALGDEYIQKYLPEGITLEDVYEQRSHHGPFSARDSASRYFDVSTLIETKQGRANEHDALYVDLTDPKVVDPLVKPRHDYFYYRGVRYLEQPIEFNICFHCCNGGIYIDENAQSSVKGLYAAGEAASGPHGANRMGGHMLTSSQVFGKIAGIHAAAQTTGKTKPKPPQAQIKKVINEITALKCLRKTQKPSNIKGKLKKITWENMLVHVDEELLNQARNQINDIRQNLLPQMNIKTLEDLIDALELKNLILLAEILADVTQTRKESRGDLYREDYPQRDDENFSKVIKVTQKYGRPHLRAEVIDPHWKPRKTDMNGIHWG